MMTSTQVVETVFLRTTLARMIVIYRLMKATISALSSLAHHIYKLICENSIKTIVFVFSVSTQAPKSQAGKNEKRGSISMKKKAEICFIRFSYFRFFLH